MIEKDIETLQEELYELQGQVYTLQKYLLQVVIAQATKERIIVNDMIEDLADHMFGEDYPWDLIKKIRGEK